MPRTPNELAGCALPRNRTGSRHPADGEALKSPASAILDAMNAERPAKEIPAEARENAEWSVGCTDHVADRRAARTLVPALGPAGCVRVEAVGDEADLHRGSVARQFDAADPGPARSLPYARRARRG